MFKVTKGDFVKEFKHKEDAERYAKAIDAKVSGGKKEEKKEEKPKVKKEE